MAEDLCQNSVPAAQAVAAAWAGRLALRALKRPMRLMVLAATACGTQASAALQAGRQGQFDAWAAQGAGITTTYASKDAFASVTVQAVPEPQLGAWVALGLVGLALSRPSGKAATRATRS